MTLRLLLNKFIFRNISWFSPFKIEADVDRMTSEVGVAITEAYEFYNISSFYDHRIAKLQRSFYLNGTLFTITFKFDKVRLLHIYLRKVDEHYNIESEEFYFQNPIIPIIHMIDINKQDIKEELIKGIIRNWLWT